MPIKKLKKLIKWEKNKETLREENKPNKPDILGLYLMTLKDELQRTLFLNEVKLEENLYEKKLIIFDNSYNVIIRDLPMKNFWGSWYISNIKDKELIINVDKFDKKLFEIFEYKNFCKYPAFQYIYCKINNQVVKNFFEEGIRIETLILLTDLKKKVIKLDDSIFYLNKRLENLEKLSSYINSNLSNVEKNWTNWLFNFNIIKQIKNSTSFVEKIKEKLLKIKDPSKTKRDL